MWSAAAWLRPKWHRTPTPVDRQAERGITTVIPSRNGRQLLEAQFPTLIRQADELPGEIIVVDNGSDDRTAEWMAHAYPGVRVVLSAAPLSFSAAVNRGIGAARYSHVCLLNNDMLLEPGFFAALRRGFDDVPDLFCAITALPVSSRRTPAGKRICAVAQNRSGTSSNARQSAAKKPGSSSMSLFSRQTCE